MREEIIKKLQMKMIRGMFTHEEIQKVSRELSIILNDYDVENRRTELAVYNGDVPEIAKMYLVSRKIEGLSENTYNNYYLALKDFFFTINKMPNDITTNDIRVYLYQYQERKDVTNATVEQKRVIIHGFFEWAANEGYTQSNPARQIKAIKCEKKEREALTQLELEMIRLACNTLREKAIIEILYSTGCRVSELTALNIEDVDFSTKEVHLLGKGSKHRTSYINAKAEIAIQEYLKVRKGDSKALIVSDRKPYKRMHKEGIEKIVKQILQRTDGEIKKHITPHNFRHTTATTALQNGMEITEISKLLGHARIDTTLIYAKTNSDKVKESYKRCII